MPTYPPFTAPHLRKRWGLDLWVIEDDRGEQLLIDRIRGDIIERWTDRERMFFGFPHEGWKILGFASEVHATGVFEAESGGAEIALQDVKDPKDIYLWTILDWDHGTVRLTGKVKAFYPAPDWWVQQTMNKLQRLPYPKSWGQV